MTELVSSLSEVQAPASGIADVAAEGRRLARLLHDRASVDPALEALAAVITQVDGKVDEAMLPPQDDTSKEELGERVGMIITGVSQAAFADELEVSAWPSSIFPPRSSDVRRRGLPVEVMNIRAFTPAAMPRA